MDDTTGPSRFGTPAAGPTPPPVDRFGNPMAPPGAPVSVPTGAAPSGFGQPAQPGFGQPAQPGQFGAPNPVTPGYYGPPHTPARSGFPKWAIALIVVVAAVPLLGIIAAVAIPVFLNQRNQADLKATSVSLPATIGTMTLSTSAADTKIATDTIANYSDGHVRDVVAGVYANTDGSRTIVVAGKATKPFTPSDVSSGSRDLTTGFLNGAKVQSPGVTTAPAGSLGGTMSCGGGSGTRGYWHACGAFNTSSFFLVATPSQAATNDGALAVREAVVTKR